MFRPRDHFIGTAEAEDLVYDLHEAGHPGFRVIDLVGRYVGAIEKELLRDGKWTAAAWLIRHYEQASDH